MRKLDNLKSWYSLEDAAKRLTITLGEEISIYDVLQMAVESHLPLSWYMRDVPAREVAPVTRFHHLDLKTMTVSYDLNRETGHYSFEPQTSIVHLVGAFKIDLELSGAFKDWVLSLMHGTGTDLIALDGHFVRDDKGNLWQIMTKLSAEERGAYGLPPTPAGVLYLPNAYFSDANFPDPTALGITRTDLEAFESLFNSADLKESLPKPLKTRERETALKLIVGMAAAWYGYDPRASKSTTITDIVNDLERKGISVSDDTIRRWLAEGAEYLPQSEEA